jgi:methylated-DNA-protein-cysteine methyltransferase-like protein
MKSIAYVCEARLYNQPIRLGVTHMEEPRLYDVIYATVRQIPVGKVATYGQISRIVGRCSAQMVGFALAALTNQKTNDDVPWQRVINAKGRISPHGFGMGTHIQHNLLEEEGIVFDLEGNISLEKYGWDGVSRA